MQTEHDDARSYANFLGLQNEAKDDFQSEGLATNMIDFSANNSVIQGKEFVKRRMKQGKYEQNLDNNLDKFKELKEKLQVLERENWEALNERFDHLNNKELKKKYEDKKRELSDVKSKMENIYWNIKNGENQKQERLLIDKFNSLNHAFVSGLLRTNDEPFLYQFLDKNDGGKIKDCLIEGAISMDMSISLQACQDKAAWTSRVRGDANILLFPDYMASNMSWRLVRYIKRHLAAMLLWGTTKPVVMTGRGDDIWTKVYSIAMESGFMNIIIIE